MPWTHGFDAHSSNSEINAIPLQQYTIVVSLYAQAIKVNNLGQLTQFELETDYLTSVLLLCTHKHTHINWHFFLKFPANAHVHTNRLSHIRFTIDVSRYYFNAASKTSSIYSCTRYTSSFRTIFTSNVTTINITAAYNIVTVISTHPFTHLFDSLLRCNQWRCNHTDTSHHNRCTCRCFDKYWEFRCTRLCLITTAHEIDHQESHKWYQVHACVHSFRDEIRAVCQTMVSSLM